MINKILFIVLDGIGDRPIKEFNYMTPLEYAETPNLDSLTARGVCGELYALGRGIRPSSDVAHMALFGTDYKALYPGRGPLELLGLGVRMQESDIAWRGNFCSLNEKGAIVDRRIQRKTPSSELLEDLKCITIDDTVFEMYHYAEHRFALCVRGNNLSEFVSDSDPHKEGVCPLTVKPLRSCFEANNTARLLNDYIDTVGKICMKHNRGIDSIINGVLLRSAGKMPKWDSFADKYSINNASCIANNALYAGIAASLGMDIVNKQHYSDYREYYSIIPSLVSRQLKESDFVFLHIAEGDLFGEDGDWLGKKEAIERMDSMLSFLLEINLDETLVVVTADHSTPCSLKAHSGDSVPLVIAASGIRVDEICHFNERCCSKGSMGTVFGKELMQIIINCCGKAQLIGG